MHIARRQVMVWGGCVSKSFINIFLESGGIFKFLDSLYELRLSHLGFKVYSCDAVMNRKNNLTSVQKLIAGRTTNLLGTNGVI